ncbi:hypothetical protein [Microbacterium sp.]|uniref:hypothetical protein n=1 Tax=Microbacterium sp. TaxID=51671 RepID=UPI0035B3DC4F
MTDHSTEQLALYMNARDVREYGTAAWDSLDLAGQEAYLKDATAFVTAMKAIGWEQPPANDPLATPVERPPITLPDGRVVYPGDNRFAVRVRTMYGVLDEQIVEASNLVEALHTAAKVPLPGWFKTMEEQAS